MTDKSETRTEFDLPELLKGNVDSVVAKLAELSPAELEQLHDLEHKGDKRTTLLGPIDAEIKRRGEAAQGEQQGGGEQQADGAPGNGDAPATFTQADLDAAVEKAKADAAAAQGETISVAEHQRLLAEKDQLHANAMQAKIAELSNKPAPRPKPAPGAKLVKIDAKADAPGLVALTGATKVQFVDDRDMSLPHLPVLDFVPAQFEPAGEAVKLTQDIEFPPALTGSEVGGAFLLDDAGKPVAKAVLVTPIKVGGGRNVKLPSGTLLFEKAPAAKAAA